jgi:hypothetical protein
MYLRGGAYNRDFIRAVVITAPECKIASSLSHQAPKGKLLFLNIIPSAPTQTTIYRDAPWKNGLRASISTSPPHTLATRVRSKSKKASRGVTLRLSWARKVKSAIVPSFFATPRGRFTL